MKKYFGILILGCLMFVNSCGCFNFDNEDLEQKRIEDSLIEIDRNNSISEADRILQEADSLDKIKQDSIENVQNNIN